MTEPVTTEEVRNTYQWGAHACGCCAEYRDEDAVAFDAWLAAHDAEVRASVLAEQGEPEGRRWFSAAYRSSNGNVIPIGDENVLREFPEAVVEEFRREDPDGPDYFLASRILPPWLPVEENKPHTEGNER